MTVAKKQAAVKGTKTAVKASAKQAAPKAPVKAEKPVQAPAFKPTMPCDAPAAVVTKAILSIAARGKKLDNEIHSTALACVFHADKHGDITLMNRLLLAMPKSSRRNALAQWAVKFGKFAPNEDKSSAEQSPLVYHKERATDMKGATDMPFWDFRNVREGTVEWNFGEYIQGVMKTLQRHALTDDENGKAAKAMLDSISATNSALHVTGSDGMGGSMPRPAVQPQATSMAAH